MEKDKRGMSRKKIIIEVNRFNGYIMNLNTDGYTSYTRSIYCIDPTFVSEIADKMRERFPDSTVVVNNSTIGSMVLWTLFNYRSIIVTWK